MQLAHLAEISSSSGLPQPPADWESPQKVASYTLEALASQGLTQWHFAWDRATQRLGTCQAQKKRITLSRHFVASQLALPAEQQRHILSTILHEIAHALAWENQRRTGHGAAWKHYCQQLGIPDERACANCPSFLPEKSKQPRYALVHRYTAEVYRYYHSKPRRSPQQLKQVYIAKRREETLGKLCIITLPAEGEISPNKNAT